MAKQRSSSLIRNFFKDETGSYLLETALVMPAFIMIVFLFIGAALGLFVYGNVTYAARSAVRYAAVRSSTSAVPCTPQQIQQAATAAIVNIGGTITTTTAWSPGNTVGSTVTVTIKVIYPLVMPFLNAKSWTLSSTSTGTIFN